ncbi:MAG TPA: heme o synthase [Opitutaceae bacterium]|nr:heme o synthase [Opitutaceae bacterium]
MTEPAKFADYLELTKPRLSALSVLTALVGYLAIRPWAGWVTFLSVLVGTSLAAAGVAVLNQLMEADTDAGMRRTAERPIPSGKVASGSAFVLGWGMCLGALMLLYALVNGRATLYALLTMVSYLALYTPAKRRSRWSTEIGAVAGALPPLIGDAAAAGHTTSLGLVLFGLMFFWQIPHFMAVAWTYRKDYAAVHFPMLPVRDQSGRNVARWSLVATVLLVVLSLLPVLRRQDTVWYGITALLAGLWMLWRAVDFLRAEGRDRSARRLFLASIAYLPLALSALVADRLIAF